tara:strand:+ start:27856 stop:27972 length:117 start_codon:yes stop_codon:yes gene_type:complete
MPKARIMVVPHPLGGTEERTIIGWVDSAVDELVEMLEV